MAATRETTNVPGIWRRGKRYEVLYRDRGQQRSKTFATMAEARAFKGKTLAGETRTQTRQRFEDYAVEWLASYQGRTANGIKARTMRGYARTFRTHLIPFFRGRKLAEIDPPDIRRLIVKLKAEGLSPRGVLAPLKAMLATAVEDGLIQSNPASHVRISGGRKDAIDDVRERALNREELALFFAAVDPAWGFFFDFLLETGLRISEAIGLKVEDIQFGEKPRVLVRRQLVRGEWDTLKSKAGRRDVPLSPAMARALWTRCADRPGDRPLFPSSTGTHLRDENLRKRVLNPARELCGLTWKGFGYHSFRHTAASFLFENGVNVKQVSRFLGHEDPAFTLKTYIHLMDAGMGDVSFFDSEIAGLAVSTQMSTEEPETTPNTTPLSVAEVA